MSLNEIHGTRAVRYKRLHLNHCWVDDRSKQVCIHLYQEMDGWDGWIQQMRNKSLRGRTDSLRISV